MAEIPSARESWWGEAGDAGGEDDGLPAGWRDYVRTSWGNTAPVVSPEMVENRAMRDESS